MPDIQISDLDKIITVVNYDFMQNDNGGNIKVEFERYDDWAKVVSLNGSRVLDNMQITYQQAFEITKRYAESRTLSYTSEVIYENNLLSIATINKDKKRWYRITAYTNGRKVNEETES